MTCWNQPVPNWLEWLTVRTCSLLSLAHTDKEGHLESVSLGMRVNVDLKMTWIAFIFIRQQHVNFLLFSLMNCVCCEEDINLLSVKFLNWWLLKENGVILMSKQFINIFAKMLPYGISCIWDMSHEKLWKNFFYVIKKVARSYRLWDKLIKFFTITPSTLFSVTVSELQSVQNWNCIQKWQQPVKGKSVSYDKMKVGHYCTENSHLNVCPIHADLESDSAYPSCLQMMVHLRQDTKTSL